MTGNGLNITALLLRRETHESVNSVLLQKTGMDLQVVMNNTRRYLAELSAGHIPDLLLVEINGQSDEDVSDLERLLAEYGDKITVFVTYQTGDIEVMRRLMRAGVRDAFPQPLDPTEFSIALANTLDKKKPQTNAIHPIPGSVIGLLESKGANGATTLAVNIAHTLVTRHRAKVILIDLDIQFGAVAMALDLRPPSHILDALLDHERIDPVFLKALVAEHDSGLDVLSAPAEIAPICNIREDAVIKLIKTAQEMYDFVVLDIPGVYTPWSISAMRLSDPLMLVIQNRLETVINAKKIIDHFPCFELSRERLEVINNRANTHIGSVSIEKLKETIHLKCIHRVRNDYKNALAAIDQGVPVATLSKKSHMTKDIFALSEQLYMRRKGEASTRQSKGLLANLFGFLSV